jgi:hypothetical protein
MAYVSGKTHRTACLDASQNEAERPLSDTEIANSNAHASAYYSLCGDVLRLGFGAGVDCSVGCRSFASDQLASHRFRHPRPL